LKRKLQIYAQFSNEFVHWNVAIWIYTGVQLAAKFLVQAKASGKEVGVA
jgi:hypothetical protein